MKEGAVEVAGDGRKWLECVLRGGREFDDDNDDGKKRPSPGTYKKNGQAVVAYILLQTHTPARVLYTYMLLGLLSIN